jgi:maltooligosyltrehalose trehalohydrolase
MPDAPAAVGAWRRGATTRFCVWAPEQPVVELVLERRGGRELRALQRDACGYWTGTFDDIAPRDLYRYRLGADDRVFPDPASRYQPEGVHGPSEVIDTGAFRWTDQEWRPPHRDDLVIYELHVGTFTPPGTFRGVIERLPYLAQLGVRAIELMPVGDFPGSRNWGYDGVAIFAPCRAYGRPEDLQDLVNAAHQHGLAVILDVVYNHLGPDGAYANVFSPHYFTDRHKSPWGRGVNMDGPHSAEVRAFFIANALYWLGEYHVDGLRLDATHAIQDDSSTHFLDELTTTIRAHLPRPIYFVAEDHRNLTTLVLPQERGGWGLDAVWADDFHHQVRVHVAGDREAYYQDYSGSIEDLARTITLGWYYTGQHSAHHDAPRGSDPLAAGPRQFVVCIQNHDQVGNRADGARLNQQVDPATFRAASALVLTVPQTPLLFQGQEWSTRAPFLFFTDHGAELGRQITAGRRAEFASFAAFADPALRERIPDPQALDTFERSRLPWSELEVPEHASMLRLYQRLIGLRATAAPLRAAARESFQARALDEETIVVERYGERERLWAVVRLGGSGAVSVANAGGARILFTTEDADVAVDPKPITVAMRDGNAAIQFARPGAILLQLESSSSPRKPNFSRE